MLRTKKN